MSGEAVVDELISELRASAAGGAMFEGEDMAQVGQRLLCSPARDLFAVGLGSNQCTHVGRVKLVWPCMVNPSMKA